MWQCSQCQETVEDDFDVCWNCCTLKPGVTEDPAEVEDEEDAFWELRSQAVTSLQQESFEYLVVWKSRLIAVLGLARYLPCAVIALLIQIPLWLLPTATADISWKYSPGIISFAIFGISLFIPRAIQQQDWKRLRVLALFGAVVPFIVHWGMVSLLPIDTVSFHRVTWPLALILLAGVAEWLRSENDSWMSLVLVTLMGASSGFVFGITSFFLDAYPPLSNSNYLNSALLLTLMWVAIPLGFWLADKPRVVFLATAALGLAAIIGIYVWTFSVGVHQIAKDSLAGRSKLFSQEYSVRLLAFHGKEEDFEFLLNQLNDADWSREFRLPQHTVDYERDWRHTAVGALIRHDEPKASEDLSSLLLRNPNRYLIDMTEGLFARQRRYETVPIFLRYAEMESLSITQFAFVGNDRFAQELDEFNVPQSAHVWIRDAFYSQALAAIQSARRKGAEFDLKDEDVVLPRKVRKKLVDCLGQDAGEFCVDWTKLYDEVIFTRPSPLANSDRNECQLVVDCFNEYDSIFGRHGTAIKRAKENGWTPPAAPDPPNWDVPTAAELLREINAYGERMDEAIQKSRPL